MSSQRIIVGVDGSPGARSALLWAAEECGIRGCTLLVVHALDDRDTSRPACEPAAIGYSAVAEQLLARDAATASNRQPGVPVTTLFTHSKPADALIDLSGSAAMVVIGTRSDRSFTSTILGTVSTRTASHALCPVAVVPLHRAAVYGDNGRGTVLVGESGGHAGRLAMEFAQEEARIRGAALRVIRAEHHPAETLLVAARNAQLLVVGCHHSGDQWSTQLGLVPASVLHRCPCPVIVVGAMHGALVDADVSAAGTESFSEPPRIDVAKPATAVLLPRGTRIPGPESSRGA